MIKLTDEHKELFIDFVGQNPTLNLFFMGDYLEFGFDDPNCEYYGVIRNGVLEVCVMNYYDSVHLSGNHITEEETKFVFELFNKKDAKIFNTSENFEYLLEELPFDSTINRCKLSFFEPGKEFDSGNIEELKIGEIDEYIEVIESVFTTKTNKEKMIDDIENNRAMYFVSKEDNKIVSVSSATAFTPEAAMIIGVGTLPEYQKKGHARRCVKALCDELYSKGMKGVLFYDNPVAGKMYHDLGFVDQEDYYLCKKIN